MKKMGLRSVALFLALLVFMGMFVGVASAETEEDVDAASPEMEETTEETENTADDGSLMDEMFSQMDFYDAEDLEKWPEDLPLGAEPNKGIMRLASNDASSSDYVQTVKDIDKEVVDAEYSFYPRYIDGTTSTEGFGTWKYDYRALDYDTSQYENYISVTGDGMNGYDNGNLSGIIYHNIGTFKGHKVSLKITCAWSCNASSDAAILFYTSHIGIRLYHVESEMMYFNYFDEDTGKALPIKTSLVLYDLDTTEYMWAPQNMLLGHAYVQEDSEIAYGNAANVTTWGSAYSSYYAFISKGVDATAGSYWNPNADTKNPKFKVIFTMDTETTKGEFWMGYGSSNAAHDVEIGIGGPPPSYDYKDKTVEDDKQTWTYDDAVIAPPIKS